MESPNAGLLVTNHLNLMFSLAAGLVMPPSGFGDKYYRDSVNAYPGWIPLFLEKIPMSAVELSTSEASHLMPVAAQLDLAGLEGTDLAQARTGLLQPSLFPDFEEDNVRKRGMLFRGPIPAARIRRIYFKTDEDKARFVSQASLRNNVPVANIELRRKKTLFTRAYKRWHWRPSGRWHEEPKPVHPAQAVGGILAMLHRFADKSEAAAQTCRAAFDPWDHQCNVPGLHEWIMRGEILPMEHSIEGYVLWGIVDVLAENRIDSNDNDLEELVLEFLGKIPKQYRYRTAPLYDTLERMGTLGGPSVQEQLQRHPHPLGRAAILLFLHRTCAELLEFKSELMTDRDWVYAAILSGARSGWLRLPLPLRGAESLSPAVSHRMAMHYHRTAVTKVDAGDIPVMPPFGSDA